MGSEEVTLPRTPSFRLDGKRALVTGAGRGIGLALAAALAEAGAQVTLSSRTAAEVEAGAAAIRARGGSSDALVLDVIDIAAVRRTIAELPPFDILVNNAGGNRPAQFLEVTEDDFDALMRLNVRGAFFTAQAVAARMAAAGTTGSIINISSQAGRVAAAGRSVYTTSKFAIEGLTKVMAVELAPKGIRVNSICPTFIETDMTRPSLDDPTFRSFVLSKIKLGRLGAVEDLMGAAVFLASDASSLMTGSSLVVDGGWTAG
jgi:NAD(P)-dependent dehydrogenase (short-subunit alcohol dehydrogenase family)